MKGSARTAVAIGAGYALGRRRNLRLAAMLAAAAATGSSPVGGLVLRRGAKLLGSAGVLGKVLGAMPPEIGDLVDTVRGDLVPAGKAAMSAAASSRVDALTDALHQRAELVRDPGAAAAEATGKQASAAGATATRATGTAKRGAEEVTARATRKTRGAKRSEQDRGPAEDLDESEDLDETEDLGEEAEEEEAPDYDEEPAENDEDDEDEEPVTRLRRTATRRRPPVTRARR